MVDPDAPVPTGEASPASPTADELFRRNKKLKKQNAILQAKLDVTRQKAAAYKLARDRLRKGLGTGAAGGQLEPVSYNSVASMDEFYSAEANVEKYEGELQLSVYRLMLSQLERLVDREPASILDAGCGLGRMTAMLKERFRKAGVQGFDFSEVAVARAQEQGVEVAFFVHDIYQPVQGSFELVVCTETLEHLLEPERAVQQLVRATDATGSLFLTVPDGRADQSARHINFWSPESWPRFLARAAPGCGLEAGVLEHAKHPQLRYNWARLRPAK